MAAGAPLAGVILAGGASRRMGRDKATLPHPDAGSGPAALTMVEHTAAVLRLRCEPLFVIAAPGQSLPTLRAAVLRDELRGVGPLLATGRGLRAAADVGAERAFVSAVDMPYLSVDVIDALSAYEGVDIVLPWDGRDHYLAGVYRTDLADYIDELVRAGARSMRALCEKVVTQRVIVTHSKALKNVNSESDLPGQFSD